MMPYLLLYTIILFFLLMKIGVGINNNKIDQLIFLLMFLFVALRGSGDGDYHNYLNGVYLINSFTDVLRPVNYPFEISFRLLSFVSNKLQFHPQFVLAVMNMISFISIYYVCRKTKTDLLWASFFFFPIMLRYDMHHSRSAVAMSLGLVSFLMIIESKNLIAFLIVLLAISFHKTAIVLIVLFPYLLLFRKTLFGKKYEFKKDFYLSVFLIIISIFFSKLLQLLFTDITIQNNYYKGIIAKLLSYIKSERWSYRFKLYDPRLLLFLSSYFLYYYFLPKMKLEGNRGCFFIMSHKIYLLSIMLLIIFSGSTILALRLFHLFGIVSVLYLSLLVDYKNHGFPNVSLYKNIWVLLLILGYISYTMFLIAKQFPYSFFF